MSPTTVSLRKINTSIFLSGKRGKLRKTEVKTGPSNNMSTIVSGDLKSGQALELPENILTRVKNSDHAD